MVPKANVMDHVWVEMLTMRCLGSCCRQKLLQLYKNTRVSLRKKLWTTLCVLPFSVSPPSCNPPSTFFLTTFLTSCKPCPCRGVLKHRFYG